MLSVAGRPEYAVWEIQGRNYSRMVPQFRLLCCHAARPSERCDLPRFTFWRLVAVTRTSIPIAVANLLPDWSYKRQNP